jgi:hypothetical protein
VPKRPTKHAGFTGCGKTHFGQAFRPGFVSGHDFSRADKANKTNRALAPVGTVFVTHDRELEFFRSLFSPCKNHLAVGLSALQNFSFAILP